MKFPSRVFNIAGAYGLIALLPMYFREAAFGHDFPPAITHAEFYYGFVGVALAFQFVFFVIAQDPVRYRLMMLPSIFEKLSFGGAAAALYFQGRLPSLLILSAGVDVLLALFFFAAYRRTADWA